MSDPKSNVGSKKGQKIPWEELKFERLKIENQAFSKCLICDSMLKNTSYDRLLAHRKICKPKDPPEVPLLKRRKENPKSANKSESSTSSNPSSGNLSEIDEALAKFFFGCNIPFSTVDSCHFRDFVHKLNPNYKPPSRNTLSGSILDEFYMTTLKKNSSLIKNDSVLLLDGWKNSSKNEKYVVGILHNANGERVFLNTWDFTQKSETAVALKEVSDAAVKDAKEIYNTNIYALVSDNVSSMISMGKMINYWHLTCNSHSGNLLAKNLVEFKQTKAELSQQNELGTQSRTTVRLSCFEKAVPVLKEFKSAVLEKELTNRGGTRICLPGDTRWCSYRDSFRCFLRNLSLMRDIVEEARHTISERAAALILDKEFEQELLKFTVIFDEVCKLINKCQSNKCNIADAVEEWLLLKFPICDDQYESLLKARLEKVINPINLAANILHPVYKGQIFSNNARYNEMANQFFIKSLDKTGLEDLNAYLNKKGIFASLDEKNVKNPETFWNLAEPKHPALSDLAKKLMNIPSSTAAIERLFSQWSYVHSKLRNRLNTETSKKLIYIYYSLKMSDTNVTDEY